jgi:hypothetical protein
MSSLEVKASTSEGEKAPWRRMRSCACESRTPIEVEESEREIDDTEGGSRVSERTTVMEGNASSRTVEWNQGKSARNSDLEPSPKRERASLLLQLLVNEQKRKSVQLS